ncbi:hypothetical protein [Pseudoalteromonas luteoviolacea]|uniref:hypothetical protein n=1 Tax=Pseudoalteromonas luteoviolacea TaxID=43657 RepID=UPI00115126C1|nr:hypothetical protein [Pseudoalteromonas luteoviolacea]TQF70194.1 hypothetical protein FLM44_03640 [Pseudoalteromonas luteoviolacea]
MGSPLHIAAHAVAGGIIADVQGGNFGHGFWSAGLTKWAQVGRYVPNDLIAGTIVSAVIGGTVSKISGGKFANGATTAAFQFVMNQWVTETLERYSADPNATDEKFQKVKRQALARNRIEIDMAKFRANQNGSDPYTNTKFGSVIYEEDGNYRSDNNKSASPRVPHGYVTNERNSGFAQLFEAVETKIMGASAVVITTLGSELSIASGENYYMSLSKSIGAPIYVNSIKGAGKVYVFDGVKND